MKRRHAVLASLLVALAVIAGSLALTRTTALGRQTGTSDTAIAARAAQLDRAEAQVRRLRAQRPPRVPAVPSRGQPTTRIVVVGGAQSHGEPSEHDDGAETESGGWDD